jgi:hypothetical protein
MNVLVDRESEATRMEPAAELKRLKAGNVSLTKFLKAMKDRHQDVEVAYETYFAGEKVST